MKRLFASEEVNLVNLFKMLNIYFYNIRVLHWKVKSDKFDEVHSLMNMYYDKLSDDVDLIAEMMLSNDIDVVSLNEVVDSKYALIDTNKDYTYDEVFNLIELMFKDIIDYIKRLLNEDSVVTKNPGIHSELENLYSFYDKELNYKNTRRSGK
jgi:starvation-inducible DNA-binding protein